ncbi:MAG TPA: Fe-S cluster assembly protein SufD [Ktedonobacteraceae bacterium]|nr:Fe-S cluster assembly protein SufD [Ktedonobacteraceae bacterium]
MANVLANGLSRGAVEELSRQKGEPEWMLQRRLRAWEIYESTPTPLGRRGDLGTLRTFSNFKFQQLSPYAPINGDAQFSTVMQQSQQEALVHERAGLIVQRNSSIVHVELDEELKQQGVILTSLDAAVREHPDLLQEYFMTKCVPVETSKYTAMNAAYWSGGIFLYVPQGVEIERPILGQVWIDQPGTAIFGHTLVIADELSSVRYVEEYNSDFAGETPSLFNGVVEVYTRSAAHVEFSSMQDFGMNVWNITNRNAVEENDGSTTWVMADLGSRAMLSDIGSSLSGNGSAAELVGVFFTDHDQRYSINSLANHIGQSTNAETMVKGALSGQSRVEFGGMIRIQPNAQYTASFLSDHTLLLSDKCRAESIPGLEIAANEVSASHGATTGKIDEEQLFYLMVRGIPQEEAERIIVQGFFEPVLQRIPLENLRVRLRRSIVRRMSGAYETEADTWVDAQERWEIEGVDEVAVHLDDHPAEDEIQLTEY